LSALDKVLLLAQAQQEEDEACDHLHGECPWFRAIMGGHPAPSAEQWCHPPERERELPRLVMKLTPRTAEASTVPQPTVPPGGPGLFHVKGMELPPYIQHLYKHLVGRYGRHRAYGVAVGVVKKWAAGINPGGWKTKSGKGKRTHPDVQAAAARNVAEWEEKRARAHAQHAATEARDAGKGAGRG